MIGQNNVISIINDLIDNGNYPQFSIFMGADGSGKRTLAKETANKLTHNYTFVSTNVDSIIDMIKTSKSTAIKTTFIIPEADKMSVQAKNALLKVLEEPPEFVYFILTVADARLLPDTVLSRGMTLHLTPYSKDELAQYMYSVVDRPLTDLEHTLMTNICDTPGDVDKLLSYDIIEFEEFVHAVVNHIDTCSGANAFKIADKLALKTDEGYDLKLFLRSFNAVCFSQYETDPAKYLGGVVTTTSYLKELNNISVNKQMLFESWIVSIRKGWIDEFAGFATRN